MRELLLWGSKSQTYPVRFESSKGNKLVTSMGWEGMIPRVRRRHSEDEAGGLELFMRERPCPECNGQRLRPAPLAVRLGGKGDVTQSHVLWRKDKGSNVGSPIYFDGNLYWAGDSNGLMNCQNAETGEFVFQERIEPRPGNIWSSAVLADGKIYLVSQHAGTFVVAAQPKYELLAHNKLEADDSRTNASPAVHDSQILLRTDKRLYCIGQR